MMKYIKYAIGLVLILAVGYWAYNFYKMQAGPEVRVKPHEEYMETYYIIGEDKIKSISITTFQTELNKGVLRLRSGSDLPLDQQIEQLSKILDRVFKDEKKEEQHTLFVGRLIYAFGENNPQMSERLALAASKSPLWDKTKGKAVSGYDHVSVEKIANDSMIYPELKELFKKHGFDIKVSGFEKILINTPDRLPIGDALLKKGVSPSDRLPFDCLTWFSLKPTK
jgi:hypothetical protein